MIPRLAVRGLTKSFPGVRALDGVSLEVQPGEVHALLGENGAGKSTLGKIVAGVYAADAGEVRLDGTVLGALDEAAAARLGIGIVHQEGSLVPQLSVAENVFAGHTPSGFLGRVDRRTMVRRTGALMDELGLALDPRVRVGALSAAQAQVVEIAKALSRDLRLLILDEPTAALTLTETERLFAVVRRLAASGVAVIYVSHRLAEIFAISQRVTVLKDGRLSGTRETGHTTEDELIRLMVGRDVHLGRAEAGAAPGEVVLEVEGLISPARRWRERAGAARRDRLPRRADRLGAERAVRGGVRRAPGDRGADAGEGPRLPAGRPVGRDGGRDRHGPRGPQAGRPVPCDGRQRQHRRRRAGQGVRGRRGAGGPGRRARRPIRARAAHRDALAAPGGGQPLGRQPAEGAAREMAGAGAGPA